MDSLLQQPACYVLATDTWRLLPQDGPWTLLRLFTRLLLSCHLLRRSRLPNIDTISSHTWLSAGLSYGSYLPRLVAMSRELSASLLASSSLIRPRHRSPHNGCSSILPPSRSAYKSPDRLYNPNIDAHCPQARLPDTESHSM
jgi:hypothetical protein